MQRTSKKADGKRKNIQRHMPRRTAFASESESASASASASASESESDGIKEQESASRRNAKQCK
uniref:HDC15650 n=1 Tax=Drosophila melanogaster TaxID=7227 RepID=Q6IJ89_DROME|nr:TPA_inf: HDC15650 [Drosophila melanogaster]